MPEHLGTRIKTVEERAVKAREQIESRFKNVVSQHPDKNFNFVLTTVTQSLIKDYSDDREKTFGILHSHYSVAKEIAFIIYETPGFSKFFLENHVQTNIKIEPKTEPMGKTELDAVTIKNNVIHGFKQAIGKAKGNLFSAVDMIVQSGVPAGKIPEDFTTKDVNVILAQFFFDDLLAMKKDRVAFILKEAKNLSKEQLNGLISELQKLV